jgi:hypothetical protein
MSVTAPPLTTPQAPTPPPDDAGTVGGVRKGGWFVLAFFPKAMTGG